MVPHPLNVSKMHFFPNNQIFRTCSSEYANLRVGNISRPCRRNCAVAKQLHTQWESNWYRAEHPHLLVCGNRKLKFSPSTTRVLLFCRESETHKWQLNPNGHRVAFSEIVPCFDPCVLVRHFCGNLSHHPASSEPTSTYFSVRVLQCGVYHTRLETSESEGRNFSPPYKWDRMRW